MLTLPWVSTPGKSSRFSQNLVRLMLNHALNALKRALCDYLSLKVNALFCIFTFLGRWAG